MRTLWETRIRHIDRPVKPTRQHRLRRPELKAKVKARRGRPSRNLPSALVMEQMRLKIDARFNADSPDVQRRLDRLGSKMLHTRMMERKRVARAAARRRARPSVDQTRIYLWRRRLEWLHDAEARL